MNLYIWPDATYLTDNYHSGGGVIAIAPTLERAREIITSAIYYDGKSNPSSVLTTDPIVITELTKEYCMIFPDAGCC